MAALLVLDNDRRIVELVALFLTEQRHTVRVAHSFREARERIAEETPDLLLSDLELGAESGREELPALWREGLLPPTLVISGYIDAALERELASIPAIVGTLAKPFDFPNLDATITRALERARARRDVVAAARELELARAAHAPAASEPDEDGWIEIRPHGPDA
jgi:DNA-binding NtrC family response regulator